MKILKLLSLFVCAFYLTGLKAQSSSLKFSTSEFSENIFKSGKYGILKYNQSRISQKGHEYIKLTFKQFDTTLEIVTSKSVLIPERFSSNKYYFSQADQTMYFFAADFFRQDRPRNKGRIVSFDMKDGSVNQVKCALHIGFWLKGIQASGGNVLVSEEFKSKKFVVINAKTGKSKKIKIRDFTEDDSYVFLEDLSSKAGYMVYSKTLPNGKPGMLFYDYRNPKQSLSLNSSKTKSLASFKGMQTESGSLILTGAYSLNNSKSKKENTNTIIKYLDRNDGVYFAKLTKDQKPLIKYFPILEDVVEDEESASSGKDADEEEFELNFVTHAPVKSGNNYLILVDFVYNKYGVVPSTTTVNGNLTSMSYSVVEQKPYYSLLIRVSEEGEVIRKDTFNVPQFPDGALNSGLNKSNFSSIEGSESDGVYKIYYLTANGLCCKRITENGLENMPLLWPKKKPLEEANKLIYLFQKNCAIADIAESQITLQPVKYK